MVETVEGMDKKDIKVLIEWCDEKGYSEHEILDLIRRIVDAIVLFFSIKYSFLNCACLF